MTADFAVTIPAPHSETTRDAPAPVPSRRSAPKDKTASPNAYTANPWRQGDQRDVHVQLGAEPSITDPPIGTFVTAEAAAEAVRAHNDTLLRASADQAATSTRLHRKPAICRDDKVKNR